MNKKQLQSEQTKKRVADAARDLFAQKGYAATSIEEIVAATGSSKGNIYYHYKSKEGLFLHLLDEWEQSWREQWDAEADRYETAEKKLYALAEKLVESDLNHPLARAADEFLTSEWENTAIQEAVSVYIASHIELNQQLIAEGIARGEWKQADAQMLGLILEALLVGLGEMSKRVPIAETLSVYRRGIDIFLHGIKHQLPSS